MGPAGSSIKRRGTGVGLSDPLKLRHGWLVIALAVAAVALLTVPVPPTAALYPATSRSPASAPTPLQGPIAGLKLQAGNLTSPYLWGTVVSPRAHILPDEDSLVNATPDRLVLFPGAVSGDQYNMINNSMLSFVRVKGIWHTSFAAPPTSVTEFVQWCRSISCTAMFQVPGEIDNPAFAAQVVRYVEVNLSFRPAYWEVGNEPALWTQWNRSWPEWSHSAPVSNATPMQYATEVYQYYLAMSTVDPNVEFIGLPGIGKGGSSTAGQWLTDVIRVFDQNRSLSHLAGVGFHEYPAGKWAADCPPLNNSTCPTLANFYEAVVGPNSIGTRIGEDERTICRGLTGFPVCKAPVPLFITEMGTSLSHGPYGPYSTGFPGAVGSALEAIEALDYSATVVANVDTFAAVFDTNNSYFNLTGTAHPTYDFYSQILPHLGNDAFPVNVTGPVNVSAIATVATGGQNRHDLLVVNYNVTTGASFSTGFINSTNASIAPAALSAAFTPGAPVEVWEWNASPPAPNASVVYCNPAYKPPQAHCASPYVTSSPETPAPVPVYFPDGLPPTWSLPPQSMALFETYNAPAYPVNFSAERAVPGFAPLAHWFVQVGPWNLSSNQASDTLLLPPGSYPTRAIAQTLPLNGSSPKERLEPILPATTVVGTGAKWVNFSYVPQWAVQVAWNASRGAVTSPGLTLTQGSGPSPSALVWWDAGTPLSLQAVPRPGYAFTFWSAQGPAGNGNVSGYDNQSVTVLPTGPVYEEATFQRGTEVTFRETNLPGGTPWTVSLRGASVTTTTSSATFWEVNGVWGYAVQNVSGYEMVTPGQSPWWNRTLSLHESSPNATPIVVLVNFTLLTPGREKFPLTFIETGLATGSLWSVTVANGTSLEDTSASTSTSLVVYAPIGVQSYTVAAPPGYHLERPPGFGSVSVLGNSTPAITLTFALLYPVVFQESGLPTGVTWAVSARLGSTVLFGTAVAPASIPLEEIDGTYGFASWAVGNASINWRTSTVLDFTVSNAPLAVAVGFLPGYRVVWSESGLPSGLNWSVAINGVATFPSAPDGWVSVNEYNGTYAFAIPIDRFSVQVGNQTYNRAYVPSPRTATITVHGAGVDLAVRFLAATVPVTFNVVGLPSGATYGIRLSDQNVTTGLALPTIQIPNGSYTFDIAPPAGFYATPQGGNVSVQGKPTTVDITILPIGRGPNPPFWVLVIPAMATTAILVLAGVGTFSLLRAVGRRRTGASL
jgi:hypothetical protein